jgi:hypothetical protein
LFVRSTLLCITRHCSAAHGAQPLTHNFKEQLPEALKNLNRCQTMQGAVKYLASLISV